MKLLLCILFAFLISNGYSFSEPFYSEVKGEGVRVVQKHMPKFSAKKIAMRKSISLPRKQRRKLITIGNEIINLTTKYNIKGYYLYRFVDDICSEIYSIKKKANQNQILKFLIFKELGYKTALYTSGNEVFIAYKILGFTTKTSTLKLGKPYSYIDNHFFIDEHYKKFLKYEKLFHVNYPLHKKKYKALNFSIKETPLFAKKEYNFHTKFNKVSYSFTVKGLVEYKELLQPYHFFPSIDTIMHSHGMVSKEIINKLSIIMEEFTEEEKIAFLLQFIEDNSSYHFDKKLYNCKDISFTLEFNFLQKKFDCEDVAMIFAYLYKELVKKSVLIASFELHANVLISKPKSMNIPREKIVQYKEREFVFIEPFVPLIPRNIMGKDDKYDVIYEFIVD